MISDEEKLLCAKRELAMRERVYPAWVKNGKMKLDMAEYQIAVMKAIVADYEQKAAAAFRKSLGPLGCDNGNAP